MLSFGIFVKFGIIGVALNKSGFILIILRTMLSIVLLLSLCTQEAFAKSKRKKSKTEVKPELIYRQVQVGHRRGSVFFKDTRSSDFVDQLYIGMKFIKTYDYRYTVLLEPAFFTERDQATKENFQIQQAYASAQFSDSFSLTTGRKVEFTGSGYFVNPSDLIFEDRNLIDPLEQRTGKNFTKLNFETEDYVFTLGYIRSLNTDFRENKGLLRIESFWFDSDILFSQTYSKELNTTTGLSISKFVTDNWELHFDGRYETKQRKNLEYQSYNAFEPDDNSAFYLLGTRYVITSKRSVILEFIQNQSGLLEEELDNYHSVLKQRQINRQNGDTSSANEIPDPYTQLVGRRFLAFGAFDEETVSNTMFKVTYMQNMYDGSSFVTTEARYKPAPIFSISWAPSFFVGEESSEFGQQPAHSVHYFVVQGQF